MSDDKKGDEMLQAFFDACPDGVYAQKGKECIILNWSRKGIGFGQVTLSVDGGKLVVDNEALGNEFAMEVIRQAVEAGHE